jgi:hypothetical protein
VCECCHAELTLRAVTSAVIVRGLTTLQPGREVRSTARALVRVARTRSLSLLHLRGNCHDTAHRSFRPAAQGSTTVRPKCGPPQKRAPGVACVSRACVAGLARRCACHSRLVQRRRAAAQQTHQVRELEPAYPEEPGAGCAHWDAAVPRENGTAGPVLPTEATRFCSAAVLAVLLISRRYVPCVCGVQLQSREETS